MKKLVGLVISFLILSCTPKHAIDEMEGKGDLMLRAMNGVYSYEQFDSMCVADTLPRDLFFWKYAGFKEYETGNKIVLYLYMKENGTEESVYKVEKLTNDSVKIIKRIIK